MASFLIIYSKWHFMRNYRSHNLGPEFQKAWNKYFRDYPDKPLVSFNIVAG